MNTIQRFASILRTGTLTARAVEPHATHIPILLGLARLLNIRSVLEFGSGRFSTLSFLNRAAFPQLETLRSFENDAAWFEEISSHTQHDPRISLELLQGDMTQAVKKVDISKFDLTFIDDSLRASDRAATIRAVGGNHASLAVVHDFEVFAYRRASTDFDHRFRFDALNPNTGVLWNGQAIATKQLRELNNLIKRHRREIQPDDILGWTQVFDGAVELPNSIGFSASQD